MIRKQAFSEFLSKIRIEPKEEFDSVEPKPKRDPKCRPCFDILQVFFYCTFVTFSLPFRITRNGHNCKWEMKEHIVQKVLTYPVLVIVVAYQINPFTFYDRMSALPAFRPEGADASLSVLGLLGIGQFLAYPVCMLSLMYTVFTLKRKTVQLLKILNESENTWLDDYYNDVGSSENNFFEFLAHKTRDYFLRFIIVFLMVSGALYDTVWLRDISSASVMKNLVGVDLMEYLDLNVTSRYSSKCQVEIAVFGLQHLPEFYMQWCYHITPLWLMVTFSIFIREICNTFVTSFMEQLRDGQVEKILVGYMKLKAISDQINSIVGLTLVTYLIGSIPFFAILLASLAKMEIWRQIKQLYTALHLFAMLMLGADAHSKVMEVRSWIFSWSLNVKHLERNEIGTSTAGVNNDKTAYWNLLHNDISTSTVALKGLSFFTINYSFIGFYFSQCLTYAIIALQSGPQTNTGLE